MKAKIKKAAEDLTIGFNNSSKPLGERKDLDLLYEIAVQSSDKYLLSLFEETSENTPQSKGK